MNFTSTEKCAIVAVLSKIMKADGIVESKEQDFMDMIYRKLGININDFQNISSYTLDDCKPIFDAMSQEKKEGVSKCLLQMVGVDGHVDLRELRVIRDLL